MWISLKHDVRPRESTVPIKYSSFIQAAAEKTRGRLQFYLPSVVLLVAAHWIFSTGGSTPETKRLWGRLYSFLLLEKVPRP